MDYLIEHFQSTRKDVLRADHCLQRFRAAIIFLEDNREALNFGKAAVVGPRASLISKHVIKTLYRFFAAMPDEALDTPISIEVFVRELQEEMNGTG